MRKYSKPIVLVSSCLEFEKVRFDGQVIPCKIVRELEPFVEYVKVCPEFSIGLGVPRPPIRIVKVDDEERLIQPKTEEDLTEKMKIFSKRFLSGIVEIDGVIFKSDSPSVGLSNIKVYKETEKSPVVDKTCGFFSRYVIEKFPLHPMEDEKRLKNKKIRHHFLTSLFIMADFRNQKNKGRLEDFFENNRLLLKLYGNDRSKEEELRKSLQRPPETGQKAEILKEIVKELGEKNKFDGLIKKYSNNKTSFSCVLDILRFEADKSNPKIAGQSIFSPYPEELIAEVEDDRNRDYYKSK